MCPKDTSHGATRVLRSRFRHNPLEGDVAKRQGGEIHPNRITEKADLPSAFSVIRLGFEPKTHSLEGCCSIQLSYRTSSTAANVAIKNEIKIHYPRNPRMNEVRGISLSETGTK